MQTKLDFDNINDVLEDLKKKYKRVYFEPKYIPTYSSQSYSTSEINKFKDDTVILKSYKQRGTENTIIKTNYGYLKFSNL
jgi:hypothetical protein